MGLITVDTESLDYSSHEAFAFSILGGSETASAAHGSPSSSHRSPGLRA